MGRQDRKFKWQTALGALAVSWGIFGAIEAPASAAPWKAQSRRIAQVGVRSQIGSPTPLNLRPQTHIPLPTNSRSRDYYGYPRSRYYGHGKYGHYRDRHYPPRRSRGGTVIIINPSNYSEYSNYNYSEYGGRVRIIGK